MKTDLRRTLLREFHAAPPPSDEELETFFSSSGVRLPVDYLEYVRHANGGEGPVGEHGYLILWAVGQILALNEAYNVQDYVPGLLLFGSDGSGEAFGFDLAHESRIVAVPFVGMDRSLAQPLADDFEGFLMCISRLPGVSPTRNEPRHGRAGLAGKEIVEIQPIILGGHPTDPDNKMALTRELHIDTVNYWNLLIRDLRLRKVGSDGS